MKTSNVFTTHHTKNAYIDSGLNFSNMLPIKSLILCHFCVFTEDHNKDMMMGLHSNLFFVCKKSFYK